MKYKPGQILQHKLTGERVIIVELSYFLTHYTVRLPNYSTKSVIEEELEKIKNEPT